MSSNVRKDFLGSISLDLINSPENSYKNNSYGLSPLIIKQISPLLKANTIYLNEFRHSRDSRNATESINATELINTINSSLVDN